MSLKVFEISYFTENYDKRELREVRAFSEDDAARIAKMNKQHILKVPQWDKYVHVQTTFSRYIDDNKLASGLNQMVDYTDEVMTGYTSD